jgi:glycosyltransferase involved in cell wall biosynthesis
VLRSQLGHLKRFPDAHLGWLPFALAAARAQPFDVAYSSSGPFTSHLVGVLLKKLTGRPWVAELRDGWYRWNRSIFPDYPVWRDVLERQLEAAALKNADRVVLVTERMAVAFRRQYADLPAHHFAVVSNGFDPAQFNTTDEDRRDPGENFEVLHAGALYYGRSLAAFLEAVSSLIRTEPGFASAFRLKLFGSLDPAAHADLRRCQIDGHITFGGQLDHASALAAMRRAAVLLLVANTTPGAEATVPGKLFEYLAAARPILAVAPLDSSTADVLGQTGGGWLAPAGDANAIACVLQKAFASHRAGTPTRADPTQVAHFDRRLLTGDLAQIFEQVHARRT